MIWVWLERKAAALVSQLEQQVSKKQEQLGCLTQRMLERELERRMVADAAGRAAV